MKNSYVEESFESSKPFADTRIILVCNNIDEYDEIVKNIKYNNISYTHLTYTDVMILKNWTNETFYNRDFSRNIMVLNEFGTPKFLQIIKYNCIIQSKFDIIGIPLLKYYLLHWIPMPKFVRPIYTNHLENVNILFNGFKDKKVVSNYVNLIHYMSGQVRTSVSNRITHLISKCAYGYKYHKLVDLGKKIVSEDFIDFLWDKKNESNVNFNEIESQFTLSTFYNSVLMFIGFKNERTAELEKIAIENGADTINSDPFMATHVIIKDSVNNSSIAPSNSHQFVLTEQWFWESVKCRHSVDVINYQYVDKNSSFDMLKLSDNGYMNSSLNRSVHAYSPQNYNRRNSIKQQLADLVSNTNYISLHPLKTPRLSQTMLVNQEGNDQVDNVLKKPSSPFIIKHISSKFMPIKQPSKRYHILLELQNTEGNYVSILDNLLRAKSDLEDKNTDSPKKRNSEPTYHIPIADSRIIFSNLPHIYNLHAQLYSQITESMLKYQDQACISDIILKHIDEMNKIYPTYVRFMDNARQVYKHHEKNNLCFQAHIMTLMNKPEFGRQTIIELLVRPVQRLPSLNLLLKTLFKNTDSNFSDYKKLGPVITKLESVISKINECNRQADKYKQMFELMNQIENCPPILLSACREFIHRCDFIEVSDIILGGSHHGTLFVYSDLLLLTKRKTKPNKSPNRQGLSRNGSACKRYKFVKMIYLNELRVIVDVVDTKECHNVVAIICKKTAASVEKMIAFLLCTKTTHPVEEKRDFLEMLAKTVTNAVSHVDYRQILTGKLIFF
ncbi:Epithelial cell-transforming sequence 2 oncogene [Intoshia linei]|uniref:Epithelial cell-transforming sequence 2 oncogene n=1 Tax=Intoshia linei TaxID=1819745 RepID=A0A177B116_9BILA|nr:Epithelial cell-transforming sequence 2 oncogene [Intoshia linei]